jgi:FAD/FMN-containing dehydrogenase
MLVDLDAFRAVSVDAATATARVEPALWGRDLLLALGRSGLAFPVSHCATVPMGGYLLGGGVGINTDEWGIACHGVVGAEVMLADGRLVEAGSAGHEELLWALRGAGTGFFGIVTRYELRCPALPRDVRENVFVFPGSRTAEVVDWLSGASARGMPRTEFMILLAQAAGKPGQTLCIARAVQFCDSEAESRALITPLAESAFASEALFRESLKPTTLDQLMIGSVDASRGLGFGRSHVHTVWTKDAPTAAAAAERLLARAPSPKSHMVISLRRDTTGRAGSSFSSVDRGFVGCYGIWDDATDDEANIAWLDTARESLQPFASGNYINELDAFRRPDLLERCFSADALARLHRLRQRYDPDGLFHDFPGLS